MRTTTVLSSDELASLARLGQTIRLARLRRNLTQAAFAERMGVGRPSVVAIENGRPGVAVGILLKALTVLGYTERLGEIVAADPIGDDMDAVLGRRRSRRSAHVADF
ncbi:helix-turn-helix domain-containing protein [Methylobacterium sp. E-041]|jgi:transcriptional regulator with XRE-family HTH domain|uniref:helix-turn-helix transcriptional regulator n=1 Tax=unclassified Methylobacterium TaxID=2615210 RepID=UPI0011C9CED1|nr:MULTISPECIES: helix-turn-helix domain-containing protein [unclassified Methylobacterium]RZK88365.1 MAG: helix-turn-helix domain-containing protein [Methylobacterium sp.]MCJ2006075.1 helix-turn-helix domain-containing protein [Methylobacterium sp. J-092]MCJ2042141.1 helix-turn-helix domain-containing protein [Methylobacterium sp. J-059]MCJ2075350.1 helix-turn-helix domain-containing protein [Methylobacterium sp. E-016]MCJ2109607.1 helix-turn-helix domain-containing protein [Methylobacterium 